MWPHLTSTPAYSTHINIYRLNRLHSQQTPSFVVVFSLFNVQRSVHKTTRTYSASKLFFYYLFEQEQLQQQKNFLITHADTTLLLLAYFHAVARVI